MKRESLKAILITGSFVLALSPVAGCNQNSSVAKTETETALVETVSEETVSEESPSEVVSTNAKPKDEYPAFVPGSGAKKYDPNEKPSETPEEVTEETSEEGNEENSETSSEEVKEETEEYTVADMEKIMYVQKGVTVREGPATSYAKLGSLKQNDEVKVTGKASTGWYRFDYNGKVGFCSDKYLGESKVVASNPPSNGGDNGTGTAGDGTHKDGDKWTDENGVKHKRENGKEYVDVGGGVWVEVRDPGITVAYVETYADMECFNAMNQLREENGLPALAWNSENEAKAKERTEAMMRNGNGHNEPTNEGMGNGENVASQTGKSAFDAYNRSEGHRANMLADYYTSCCVITSRTVLSDGTYGKTVNCIIFWVE